MGCKSAMRRRKCCRVSSSSAVRSICRRVRIRIRSRWRNGRIVGIVQAVSSKSQLLVCNTQKRNEKKRENEATFMLTKWVGSVNIYPLVLCWCSTVVVQLICNQQVGGSNPSTSSKFHMGEFPSGQRGQTVNLLSTTSVVRIHLPPPKLLDRRMAVGEF